MPGLSLYLLNARYLFFVPSKREIACRRRRRRIFSTSRVARLKSAQKNARQKRTYKKKRGSRVQLHLALFGVALSARVARKIRANDLLVVLVARSQSSPPRARHQNEEEIQHPRLCVCVVIEEKKRTTYLPGRYERVFSIDAPAVRSGRRRVRVVVEIEALFARRGQTGHSLRYSFSSSKVVVESRRPKHLKCCCGEISLLLDESVQIARIF